jgi:hypothetical protein
MRGSHLLSSKYGAVIKRNFLDAPLYWEKLDGEWWLWTLSQYKVTPLLGVSNSSWLLTKLPLSTWVMEPEQTKGNQLFTAWIQQSTPNL